MRGNLASSGFERNGERATNAAHTAVKRELSDEKTVRDILLCEAAVGSDDAQGHGQVEPGTFLLDVGGGEVDGDLRGRNVVAAVLQSGADAVAAFAHSGVGQADGVEVILVALDAGAVDFHLNNVGVDAVDGGAESLIKHVATAGNSHSSQRMREMGHPAYTQDRRAHEVLMCQIPTVGTQALPWL